MQLKTKAYYPQIDVLRFLAVLAVIINHWLPDDLWINRFQIGRLGVDLFFVISGFLISRILLKLKDNDRSSLQNWRIFFIRRVLRIFPLYYAIVILTRLFNGGVVADTFIYNLTYTTNFYILQHNEWPGIVSHFWSLSVEEHFYLFWPFLLLIPARKFTLRWMLLVLCVGVCSRAFFLYFGYAYDYTYVFTTSCLDAFAIGGILALWERRAFIGLATIKAWLPVIILSLFVIMAAMGLSPYLMENSNLFSAVLLRFFAALTFFFLLLYAIHSEARFLHSERLIFMGKLSYAMYLVHNFIPGAFMGLTAPTNMYLRFIIYFSALLLISYVLYKLIEMPFNAMKKRFPYPLAPPSLPKR